MHKVRALATAAGIALAALVLTGMAASTASADSGWNIAPPTDPSPTPTVVIQGGDSGWN